jgi:hypothetical protein
MADYDYTKPAYAYRIDPIWPRSSANMGFATAAVMDCMVSGKMLSGSGGGGDYISPEVYELLYRDKEVRALIRQKLIDKASKSE